MFYVVHIYSLLLLIYVFVLFSPSFLHADFHHFLLVPQKFRETEHDDFSHSFTISICSLSSASVTLYLLVNDAGFGLAFDSSSYEFSIAENEPSGAAVGSVKALPGSIAVQVTYSLKSHSDKFSINDQGDIVALASLDREEVDQYSLIVEAVDSVVPPNTAVALVQYTAF